MSVAIIWNEPNKENTLIVTVGATLYDLAQEAKRVGATQEEVLGLCQPYHTVNGWLLSEVLLDFPELLALLCEGQMLPEAEAAGFSALSIITADPRDTPS